MKTLSFSGLGLVVLLAFSQVGCAAKASVRTTDATRRGDGAAVQVAYTTAASAKPARSCPECPACPVR